MKSGVSGGAARVDRKLVEKNRRIHMKSLCFKLSSLIPKEDISISKEILSQQDHLDQAASYIKKLQARIERLKQRKESGTSSEGSDKDGEDEIMVGLKLPVIEVRRHEAIMEVTLITGLKMRFMFYEVIAVVEEEGAEVLNASFSAVGDKIFYTIHCQPISPKICLEASKLSERLKELVR